MSALHIRLLVAVGAADSYCVIVHVVSAAHARSDVSVADVLSYSVVSLHTVSAWHTPLKPALHADTWYSRGEQTRHGWQTVSNVAPQPMSWNVLPATHCVHGAQTVSVVLLHMVTMNSEVPQTVQFSQTVLVTNVQL